MENKAIIPVQEHVRSSISIAVTDNGIKATATGNLLENIAAITTLYLRNPTFRKILEGFISAVDDKIASNLIGAYMPFEVSGTVDGCDSEEICY